MPGTPPANLFRQLATTIEPAPDQDLLARFAAGRDGAAFAELVRRHSPVVLAACRRGTRNTHDADDAFQAVFLILARRAGAVQRPELLGNWLYRVAVRVAWRARRAAARRRLREVQGVEAPEPVAPPADAPDDLGPVLDEELAGLAAWYRDAVVLCDLRGLSRADAAAQLDIPLGTLASRLDAARKKLAARLVRRGVTLSVGAALIEARAVAVPDALLAKTCGLVTNWVGGGSVPAAVLRLAQGGFTMRVVLLGGFLALTLAAGVALAAGFSQPPAAPQRPPELAVAVVQPEAKPAPGAEKDQPPAAFGEPQLTRTHNLGIRTVSAVAWSRDGGWMAVAGVSSEPSRAPGGVETSRLVVLSPADAKLTPGYAPLPPHTGLVGFTTDAKRVLAVTRETGLISGENTLHGYQIAPRETRDPPDSLRVVELEKERDGRGPIPHGEQLTPTGPNAVRYLVHGMGKGGVGRVAVWEADLKFEKRRVLGGFDGAYLIPQLTPDGKRVVTLSAGGTVEGHDAASGKKLWATEPAAKFPEMKVASKGVSSREQIAPAVWHAVGVSADGRRAIVARGPLTPVLVLDVDSGKSLPLPPDLAHVAPAGPVALSGDGRLAAMSYTPLLPLDGKERLKGGGPAFAAATHVYGETQLTVWETATGNVVRTWPGRAAAVAFHPTRPVLAVFEANGGGTRLGLWDFTAQP